MLNGSLKGQYQKLYPRKVQDSIARVKDSIDRVKKKEDSIKKAKTENKDIFSDKNKTKKKDTVKLKT